MSTTDKRQALILIPTGGDLPLASPTEVPSLPVGFFLVELAGILERFEDTHEFTLVTPDGQVPIMDLNGIALAYHAVDELGPMMQATRAAQAGDDFDVDTYRAQFASLVERRERELKTLERHLGRLRLTPALPATDREAALMHDTLAARLAALPERTFASAREIIERHRNPEDSFDLGEFDFIHAPGGHAPMVSFRDDPWLGELLHVAREREVVLSLICHAPVILTSTQFRVDAHGESYRVEDNAFSGITVSTVPQAAERMAEDYGYLHQPTPGETRLTYYIDEALEQAGIHNLHKPNPASVEVHPSPSVGLLSTNGPQGIDALAESVARKIAAVTA
ncbi:hypothetical protein [Microbacterium sp. RG1]|uniref:hypothetical protein n=1 Tax=Microbacterium sp. RG1 TaxID=2489212 RepID=UPI0010CA601D|nr:hypothetical protein [Microbacterium sp. RG1]QCQ16615.1 hypothetical protein EHF32_07700 [Microbacterium sp. RG1]